MEIILLIVGLILFIAGVIINYTIKRRRFYRRGPGGLQHFSSYGKAVSITFLERIGKILGILLLLAGMFFIFSYIIYKNDPELKARIEKQINRKPQSQ